MKFKKVSFVIFLVILLCFQFSCNDNSTDPNDEICKEWFGQVSSDFVQSVLKSDGRIWNLGYNYSGTLGNGTKENSEIPTRVLNIKNAISIDQSYGAEVAIDKNGNIWFWGNLWIYAGPPNIDTNVVTPFIISHLDRVKKITITNIFIFVLRDDNSVWSIKLDYYTPTIVEGPIRIQDAENISFISKNLAVTKDGLIYDLIAKEFVHSENKNVIAVSGNRSRHILSLKSDGTVWAWGNNDLGQLGNGTFDNSEIPVKVNDLTEVVSISANYDFNLALKKDGSVWFWGFTGFDGDSLTCQNVPIKIDSITNAVLICSGYDGLIMTNDSKYWNFNVKEKVLHQIPF